jgi:formylglycine-generating enzyme required for sulfatase activity
MDTRRFPVEQVNWEEAMEFCNSLANQRRGLFDTFRLPTEAEWEYACRAGTRSPFHFGATLNGTEANVDGNNPYGTSTKGKYLQRTCEVGKYAANALGLYDMHGNVWEWCMDWYAVYPTSSVDDPAGPERGSYRKYRGGAWDSPAEHCRAAIRFCNAPTDRFNDLGFRLALVLSAAV